MNNGKSKFVYPAIIAFVLFYLTWYLLPLFWTAVISITDSSLGTTTFNYIGLDNYSEALFHNSKFWKAIGNSVYYALGSVIFGISLAVIISGALSRITRYTAWMRIAYYLPVIVTTATAAIIWRDIFQPRYGVLNNSIFEIGTFLGFDNIPEIKWTTSADWSMPTIILFGIWKNMGLRIILILAAIQSIPGQLYEIADLDGFGAVRKFLYITLPLIFPVIIFLFISGFFDGLRSFGPMYIVTNGGPLDSTLSFVMLLREEIFQNSRAGYGAAISLIFLLCFLLSAMLATIVRRHALR